MLKCAIIGVGYLGRFHAQKYHALPDIELVAVCDTNSDRCEKVGRELNVPAYLHYEDLLDRVDAVSIAAPTPMHYEIAKHCITAGVHVLVEKPITETVEQANELIKLAKDKQIILQIGHLERFNTARLALDAYLDKPLFVESHRLAPFSARGTDVNVVLDLMIHDIDLIQAIVGDAITQIDAHGASIMSKTIDIANVKITFANHCIANLTASRISFKTERKMRIFQANSYLSLDYHNKQFAVFQKANEGIFPGMPEIISHQSELPQGDALLEEIKAFVQCIKNGTQPLVGGKEGRDALATAVQISSLINASL